MDFLTRIRGFPPNPLQVWGRRLKATRCTPGLCPCVVAISLTASIRVLPCTPFPSPCRHISPSPLQVWGVSFNSTGTHLASVADDKRLVVYAVA